MFRTLVAASVCGTVLSVSAASASTLVLDFDGTTGIASGVANLIVDDGVTWALTSSGGAGPALFDTLCVGYGGSDGCNGDADLVPNTQGENGVAGNVLIQQNPNVSVPNDDPFTEWLEITLVSDIQVVWESVSLVDEGTYVASTNLDGVLGSTTLTSNSETDQIFFGSSILGKGDSVRVTFFDGKSLGASGAIDNLVFSQVSEVPLPAPILLLLAGIGSMAGLKRFRRRPEETLA